MKKMILAQMVFCTLIAATPLSVYAGNTNTESTTAVNPDSERDNMSTNDSTNVTDNDDGDDNYGWIGFIGLLGLAGLMRKDRGDANRPVTR